jgi:hypothetical protein
MTSSELRDRARQGRISHDALVRKGDDGDWILVDRIKGLFDSTGQAVPSKSGGKRPAADSISQRVNGHKRGSAKVEDEAEEVVVLEDQRPPWFKKRYIFSSAVVLGVAIYLVTSLMRATQEQQTVQQSYFEQPKTFETVEEELDWYEVRLRNLSTTSNALAQQLTAKFGDIGPAAEQIGPGEIEEFRQSLDLSEIDFIGKYTEGISDADTLRLLNEEYFLLVRQMEQARDGLEELKNNNPSEYKIQMFIDALDRVQQTTITQVLVLIKLARNLEARSSG